MKVFIEREYLDEDSLITIKMENDETGVIIVNNIDVLNKIIKAAKNVEWMTIDNIFHIKADEWRIEVLKPKFQLN